MCQQIAGIKLVLHKHFGGAKTRAVLADRTTRTLDPKVDNTKLCFILLEIIVLSQAAVTQHTTHGTHVSKL